MFKKSLLISLSLSFLLVFSCVSKKEYLELENRMNEAQAQSEQDKRSLQDQISKLRSENNRHLDTIAGLKNQLEQERRTVEQKAKEVSELDKTRMEIESSLKEQIAQEGHKIRGDRRQIKSHFCR